jgi:hypothetical protein
MQLLGVRRAKQVDHGKRTIGPNADGVDHQRVAFVMADGIAMPRWPHLRRMRLIHAHASDFMILVEKHHDLAKAVL